MFPNLEFIKTCLNAITAKFRRVKSDINAVKSDVDAVKSDVNAVKSDVDTINSDVDAVKSDINAVKPDVDIVKSDVDAVKSDVNAVKSNVNAVKSSKMDNANPTGYGSFSLNRKSGTTVGRMSHAEGNTTTASGESSHAEGYYTTASNTGSHAEGYRTTASALASHAEGNGTTASSAGSHAEGGSTTASGGYSHAEGHSTTASHSYSHAEGYNTKAASGYQHVQGKFNIEDSSNTYADILGNGTSDTERSNAATVDWSGNAWYAGDVYTGSTCGTNKDAGSKKLATEEYVDSAVSGSLPLGLTGASAGQIPVIKTVDTNGVPTEYSIITKDEIAEAAASIIDTSLLSIIGEVS